MSSSFIPPHWINWFYLCKDLHAAGEHSIWMSWKQFEFGFTAHYHGGEVWVIWFYRTESWCMWILQALRNPVSERFSCAHRTGVKAKPYLYYWGQITSTPGAPSSNVGGSLMLGCWRNVHFHGMFPLLQWTITAYFMLWVLQAISHRFIHNQL